MSENFNNCSQKQTGSPRIISRNKLDLPPLTFAQQRLWFFHQLEPGTHVFNKPMGWSLRGPLNISLLEQSLQEIQRRHETLRTTFEIVEEQLVQVVASGPTFTLQVIDLRNCSESTRETEALRLVSEEKQQPFNLTQDPLLRGTLLSLDEEDYILILTTHQIVFDLHSENILLQELAILYDAFSDEKPSPLSEPIIQYVDFARWQRQRFQQDVLNAQLSYWKQQRTDTPHVPPRLADRIRPTLQTHESGKRSLKLPTILSRSLEALSHQEGVPLYVVLLAAFQILLHRYTELDDVITGSLFMGRNHPEIRESIGLFVSTVMLRTNLSGNPTFRGVLRRTREVVINANNHQDLPFEKLMEDLSSDYDLSNNPLFQVMFTFQSTPKWPLELSGLTVSPIEVDCETATFDDLSLSIIQSAEGLKGVMKCNTEYFDTGTITRMLSHFQTLLESIVCNPDQSLSELSLLTAAERHLLLVEWNNTQTNNYSKDLCLHSLFEAQVQRTPDAVAVVFGDEHLTYQELNYRANQLAKYIQKLGVGPEVPVGIFLERSIEMVVSLLAILKAGGAYVPLNPADPKERLAFILADAQVPVMLTQKCMLESLPEHTANVVCLDTEFDNILRESKESSDSGVLADNVAYVIYTSGSTGIPKGVLVSHSNVVRLFFETQLWYEFDERDVWTLFHSIAFDFSVWELWGALLYGGRAVVVPNLVTWSPEVFYNLLCNEQVTVLNQTPSAFINLIRVEEAMDAGQKLSLRRVICGGEALDFPSLKPWLSRHGDQSPQVINMYGITETTVHVTYYPVSARDVDMMTGVLIGHSIPDLQTYVLSENLHLMPVGTSGELYVGGAGLSRGYLNRSDLTALKFIPHPFTDEPGARLYKTGDMTRYRKDGKLVFLGRIDDQVKLRGFRVELGEIETLLSQHPSVQQNVVLAREDGPGDKYLAAYVIPDQKQVLPISKLRSFLKEKLPDYMVPSVYVMLPTLPLTANGKIDRQALPAPDRVRPEPKETFVAPRDELEVKLTEIWEKVLDLKPIGVKDHFFELGGYSLLAGRLFNEIEKKFGKNLPLSTLFKSPTIEQFANVLRDDRWSAPESLLVPIKPNGKNLPFFTIHGGDGRFLFFRYLARRLGREQPFYSLRPRGLDCKQVPYTRIEEMAAEYIEEIRTIQPEGPYCLGGMCFGGMVAFEMAQQLAARGQKIALLVMFDTYHLDLIPLNLQLKVLFRLSLEGDRSTDVSSHKTNFFRKSITLISRILMYKVLPRIWPVAYRQYQRIGWPLPRALRDVFQANLQAEREYVPKTYPGRLILFNSESYRAQFATMAGYDLQMGWGKLASDGVEVHKVPGGHRGPSGMFREPHVQVLAEKLGACLRLAQTNVGEKVKV